jgi:hypothetical protein
MDPVDDPKGYYRALGVGRDASAEELKAAFRERAKLWHPDQGGPDADEDRFRHLVEAYEVLRDPVRRRAYDESGFRSARERAERQTASARPRPAGRSPRLTPRPGSWPMGSVLAVIALALVSLAVTALWWSAERQLALADAQIQDLSLRLSDAVAAQADTRTRYRASTVAGLDQALQAGRSGGGFLFAGEVAFPPGGTELDPEGQRQLEQAILGLAEAVRKVPADRDWLILVESFAAAAASPAGVEVGAWEKALLRMALVVDTLARQGLPAERLAGRFQAGMAPPDQRQGEGRVVEIKLLCCFRPG